MMEKRVRVTIEMDNEFLRQLRINCTFKGLGNLREDVKPHTAMDALAVLVMMEGMGGLPEQIHANLPLEWRPHVEAIHDKREVIQDGVVAS